MPSYKVHIAAGAGVFLGILQIANMSIAHLRIQHIALFAVAALIGSLFPDIDVHTSKIYRYFFLLASPILLVIIFTKSWDLLFIMTGICLLIPILQHRTLTHSIWFIISIPGITALFFIHHYHTDFHITIFSYLFFSAAALSHIVLDRAITLLKKPFKKKK